MPARIIIDIHKLFHCYPICHFRANRMLWLLWWRKGFNDAKIEEHHSDNRKANIKLRYQINVREKCYSIITLGGFPICFQDWVSQEGKTSVYVPHHSNSKTRQHTTDKETKWKKLPGDRSLRRMNARPVQPIPARSHSHSLRPTRGLNSSASVQRVRSPATHMLDCITAHVLDHTFKKN